MARERDSATPNFRDRRTDRLGEKELVFAHSKMSPTFHGLRRKYNSANHVPVQCQRNPRLAPGVQNNSFNSHLLHDQVELCYTIASDAPNRRYACGLRPAVGVESRARHKITLTLRS